MHPLESILNAMIATDTRPVEERDLYQAGAGVKRTQIISAKVIPATEAGTTPASFIQTPENFYGNTAGSTPLIKQETEADPVANRGDTTWGSFTSGPLTAEAINQGQLSDCYLLIAMYLIARLKPNFFDDIFVKIDAKTAVVQWWWGGNIVQITCSLLISTDYDHPSNGDVRPELAEKTYCLVKAGIADYAQDNFGLIYSIFTAFGLDGTTGTLNSDSIIAAMQAGKAVGIQTTPTATGNNSLEAWVQSHAYGVVDYDPTTKNLTLVQPWYAVKQITGVAPSTVAGGQIFNLVHVGTFPAAPRILASMVSVPNPTPAPVVTPSPTPALPAIDFGASFPATLKGGATMNVSWPSNADTVQVSDLPSGKGGWGYNVKFSASTGGFGPTGKFTTGVQSGDTWTFTASRAADGAKLTKTVTVTP